MQPYHKRTTTCSYMFTEGQYTLIHSSLCPPTTISLWPVARHAYGARGVHIISRPLGGREYVVSDHLGSTKAVVSDMGAILERKDYKPFGSVLATAGTGARTGYIDRDEDNESGLGSYGVRLYEPEYGRFTSVDVLWEEYGAQQPYQYALNQPISLFDHGGQWVQAMDAKAREAIHQSVQSRFRSSISFSEQGKLKIAPLKTAAHGEDVNSNIAILSRLAENNETILVNTTTTGYNFKDRATGSQAYVRFNSYNAGITLPPTSVAEKLELDKGMPTSNNGMFEVHINANQKAKPFGETAAHELYAHVSLILQAILGNVDPKAGIHQPMWIVGKGKTETNKILEERIKSVESEAGK